MKRRDLLDASKLLRRHKMDPSDMASLGLAAEFLEGRKEGEIKTSFQSWLDEEIEEDEDEDAVAEGGDIDDVSEPGEVKPAQPAYDIDDVEGPTQES